MSDNVRIGKICKFAMIFVAALFIFLSPNNSFTVKATRTNSDPSSLNNVAPSTIAGSPNTSINDTPYWPANPNFRAMTGGYTDDVYLPEDTAQTLWNGTNGNGTNTPTVTGTVNGVTYTPNSVIPNTVFNALYYYLNYGDVRENCGANTQILVDNWVLYGGIAPGRVVNRLIVRDGSDPSAPLAQYGSSSYDYVVPSKQLTQTQSDGMTVIRGEVHSNGGMNRQQEIQARSIAYQIAAHVFNHVQNFGTGSQIEMVAYSTGIVRAYCDLGSFTTSGTYYRTAYGVFIQGEYSSAGATRALGLIIDYLDELCQKWNTANNVNTYGPLKWEHINANTWNDQYCRLVCDYHEAYADPVAALTGYGPHPNNGGVAQDYQSYVTFAFESDIISTRGPRVDGQSAITSSPQKNANLQR